MENTNLEQMLFGLKELTDNTQNLEIKSIITKKVDSMSRSQNHDLNQDDTVFIVETISKLSKSFESRKSQMLSDTDLIKKINNKIDQFRSEHFLKVDGLVNNLMNDIDEAVMKYAEEIERRLDPKVIKERFHKKEDFELWLTTLNNSYKSNMEKTVDRKTQSVIRNYLVDVEDVFEYTSSLLAEREQFLTSDDQFYGALSHSKSMITNEIRNNINGLVNYNKSLFEASEDLFNSVWAARKKYDNKRYATTAVTTAIGAGGIAAGTALSLSSTLSVMAASAAATSATASAAAAAATTASAAAAAAAVASTSVSAAAAAAGAASTALSATGAAATAAGVAGATSLAASTLPIIAGAAILVISGLVISKMAFKLSNALYSGSMEKEVASCIEEFKYEINQSKLATQAHITENIKLIFDNEMKSLDRTFLDLRKITYLDEAEILKLETKLNHITSEVEQNA